MKSDQETERVYSYNPGGRMPGPQKNISKLEQHSAQASATAADPT